MGRKAFKVPIVGINIYLLKDELERLDSSRLTFFMHFSLKCF